MPKTKIGFVDLKAMFDVVREHINSKEFSRCSEENKKLILSKYKELEEEVYNRLYDCNPFVNLNNPTKSVGKAPDLDSYIVMQNGKLEKV